MTFILVRHRVRDFDAWKPVFDEHGQTRKTLGGLGGTVYRSAEDPNDVTVLMRFGSVASAKEFMESSDIAQAMEKAGVVGEPQITFLEKVEDVSQ